MKFFNNIKRIFFYRKKNKINLKNKKQKNINSLKQKNLYALIGENNLEDSKQVLTKISGAIPEDQTLYKLSKFFSNFSDNTRLKIISCLSFGELCVSDIAKILNMNQTTISHQLAYLKSSGTVTTRREGKIIYYSLATSEIQDCLTYGTNFIEM